MRMTLNLKLSRNRGLMKMDVEDLEKIRDSVVEDDEGVKYGFTTLSSMYYDFSNPGQPGDEQSFWADFLCVIG